LVSFLEDRTCIVENNIINFFNLSEFDFSCNSKVIENDNNRNLILAPNPCNGVFYIYNNEADIINANITITDVNGRVVSRITNFSLSRNEHKYFNLSYLPGNIYFFFIESGGFNKRMKFIIIR
jgi:hypothetical protein